MDAKEFNQRVADNPQLLEPLNQAERAYFGETKAVDANLIFIMMFFPVVQYLFINVGLPWVKLLKELSDLQIEKLRHWIEQEYKEIGVDPAELVDASGKFYKTLVEIEDDNIKKLWQALAAEIVLDAKSNN